MGGKFLPKLNISRRPIAYKYREGNVKRTLKRELKVFETVNDQAMSFIGLCGGLPELDGSLFNHSTCDKPLQVHVGIRCAECMLQRGRCVIACMIPEYLRNFPVLN